MDKWIREPVEWSEDDCYVTCPYCNGPTGLVTKDTSLKYCPHCGARMDYKTCKDCIYETECNLNTEACERFKDKELYNKMDKE